VLDQRFESEALRKQPCEERVQIASLNNKWLGPKWQVIGDIAAVFAMSV